MTLSKKSLNLPTSTGRSRDGHARHILACAAPIPCSRRATHRTVPQAQQNPALLQPSGKGAARILTRSPQYAKQLNKRDDACVFPLKRRPGSTQFMLHATSPRPPSPLNPFPLATTRFFSYTVPVPAENRSRTRFRDVACSSFTSCCM